MVVAAVVGALVVVYFEFETIVDVYPPAVVDVVGASTTYVGEGIVVAGITFFPLEAPQTSQLTLRLAASGMYA